MSINIQNLDQLREFENKCLELKEIIKNKENFDKNIDNKKTGHIIATVQNIILRYGNITDFAITEGEAIARAIVRNPQGIQSSIWCPLIWKALYRCNYNIPNYTYLNDKAPNNANDFDYNVTQLKNIPGWCKYAVEVLNTDFGTIPPNSNDFEDNFVISRSNEIMTYLHRRDQGGQPNLPQASGLPPSSGPPINEDISNYIFTQEIDCAPRITPIQEEDCKRNNCKGMKTIDGVNKCYDVNYNDIIKQFVDKYNFTELKNKSVLPTPDRGSCLFISIVESIARDNDFKLNYQNFNINTKKETATNPKVTYEFNNNYLEDEASKLRNCVVDFIVLNWGKFKDFLNYTKEDYSFNPNIDPLSSRSIRSMRNPGTYAGHPEIIAISTLLNINIHILNISEDVTRITYNKFSPNPNLEPGSYCNQYNIVPIDVYIGYKSGNHYFALVNNL